MRNALQTALPRVSAGPRRADRQQGAARSLPQAADYELEPRRMLTAVLPSASLLAAPVLSQPVLIYAPRAIASPTTLAVAPMNGGAALTWSPPANTGGAAVTDYWVQYSSNGSNWITYNDGVSSATAAKVMGLVNGSSYLFRVAAQTPLGMSSYSATSLPCYPRTTPAAPTSLACFAGDQQVTLTWTPPFWNGGAVISGYVVQYSRLTNGSATSWQTWSGPACDGITATITGLANGTNYAFRVAAVNVSGAGAYSSPSLTVQPVAAPMITSTAARDRAVYLSWTTPPSSATAPITAYSVQYAKVPGAGQSAAWAEWGRTVPSAPWAEVTGLTNGVGYQFRVAAITARGCGPTLQPTSPVVPGVPNSSFNTTLIVSGQGSSIATSSSYGVSLTAWAGSRLSYGTPSDYDGLPVLVRIRVAGVHIGSACVTTAFIGKPFSFTTSSGNTYRGVFNTTGWADVN